MRVAAILVAAVVIAPVAFAKGPVFATLTKALPAHAAHGDRVVVSFTLRDKAGRPVVTGPVYVKLICPTRDAFTRTLAYAHTGGRYRVTAVVPPGGLGTIEIGMDNARFRITNPGRH
jgi:hypothetical protein